MRKVTGTLINIAEAYTKAKPYVQDNVKDMLDVLVDIESDRQDQEMAMDTIADLLGLKRESEPKLDKYDAINLHPVVALDEHGEPIPQPDNQTAIFSIELTTEGDPNIHCWSIYLVALTGEVTCIADCPVKEAAEVICEILRDNIEKLQKI